MKKKGTFAPQNQDMLLLKWPVLLLGLGTLVSAAWCFGAFQFRESSNGALQAALANRTQMETSVRRIEDEEKTVRGYIDRYQKLAEDGVICDEDRLGLVENIGRLRARYKLYPVHLDIERQAMLPLAPDGGEEPPGTGISLRVSRVLISIPLLHEEDLSRMLDELDNMQRGIFVAEKCSIQRTGGDSGGDRPQLHENLTAFCKILWLTLKKDEGAGGQQASSSLFVPAARAGETLERLFFTPREREDLEKLRWVSPESTALLQRQQESTAVAESKPQVYTLSGTVTGKSGVQALWLNGARYSGTDLPANVKLHPPFVAGQILFHVPETGKSYTLRPGQTLDTGDGRIRESYERPAPASISRSPSGKDPAQETEPPSEPPSEPSSESLRLYGNPLPSKPGLAEMPWPLAEISY